MSTRTDMVSDEAIAWHLGLAEAGADEWLRFVAWLEADPAHAEAYDRLTLADAALTPALVPAAAPRRSTHLRWLRWSGGVGALAAAAAAAWLAVMPAVMDSTPYAIETAPGQQRMVKLADGTEVRLNGATRLTLDRDTPRLATLERGQAQFTVVHDQAHPFEVQVGGTTLRDVGTRFDVTRAAGRLSVAVAEGEVLFQPEREKVSLTAGMALALNEGEGTVAVGRTDAGAVGGWTQGRLDYRNAALSTVAADVARSTGETIALAPVMAARSFTGTLRTDRAADEVVRNFSALADGELRRDGPGWRMTPKTGGGR